MKTVHMHVKVQVYLKITFSHISPSWRVITKCIFNTYTATSHI